MQEFAEFESLLQRPLEQKNLEFQRQGRLKHLISASQLTIPLLEKLCHSADLIRKMNRNPQGNQRLRQLLAHKRAMLYFTHATKSAIPKLLLRSSASREWIRSACSVVTLM